MSISQSLQCNMVSVSTFMNRVCPLVQHSVGTKGHLNYGKITFAPWLESVFSRMFKSLQPLREAINWNIKTWLSAKQFLHQSTAHLQKQILHSRPANTIPLCRTKKSTKSWIHWLSQNCSNFPQFSSYQDMHIPLNASMTKPDYICLLPSQKVKVKEDFVQVGQYL